MRDGGEFRCRAENRVGAASYSARLNVIGPPHIRSMTNVTVVSGLTAIIRCRVTGYPIHSITWKKADVLLPVDPRQQVHKNGTLYVHTVDKAFDEGWYVCAARNDRGETDSGSVYMSVKVPPQIAPLSFPPKLHVGTRARLQCVVTEGDLPITFLWLKDGLPLGDDLALLLKLDDEFSTSLTFPKIGTRHNGNYTCVARNAAASTNYSATLTVEVPPMWLVQPANNSVALGKSVVVTCAADGFPKPRILWKKAYGVQPENFQELLYANEKYKVFGNGSLLIQRTSEHDEGFYLCHAKNGIGPGLTKVVHLSVEAAVRFEIKFQNLTCKKGDTLTLKCLPKGDSPITTEWKLNGLKINENVDYRYVIKEHKTLSELVSVLEIYNVDIRDSGTYSCVASNYYGKDESIFHLSVRDIPDPPENVKITEHLSRFVRLTWAPPFDGGSPIKKYIVQFKNGSEDWGISHLNVTVKHPETTAVIKNLRPGTAYSFRVLVANEVGVGKPSSGVGIRTTEEAPTGPPVAVEIFPETSQSVKVTWKPPPKDGRNGEIVGYSIGYKLRESTDPFTFKGFESNSSRHNSYVIGGLPKFSKISVVVRAYNRIGVGPNSEEVFVTTMEDVPSEPPGNIRCKSSSPETLEVLWDPPSKRSQNGLITHYKLLYRPVIEIGGLNNAVSYAKHGELQERLLSGSTLSAVLQGLRKFTNYSVEMVAATQIGDGVLSDSQLCHTNEDVPAAPADIKAIAMSSNVIFVTWRPPANPNGKIVSYNVYVRQINGAKDNPQATKSTQPAANGLKYEARGLKEGTEYEFWVTSSTSVGEGSSTKVVKQKALYKAAAGIAAFSDRVFSYWQSNVSLLCPVIGMPTPTLVWTHNNLEKSSDRFVQMEDGTLTIYRIQRQDAGNYTCSAKNMYGSDRITYELLVLAPPPPPLISVLKTSPNSIDLAVRAAGDGGIPIKGYVLSYKEFQGKWNEMRLDADDDKVTLRNLRCGALYQVYVTAQNDVGIGEPSAILPVSTRGTAPAKPSRADILQPNATSITLRLYRWPVNDCPVQRYSLQYRRRTPHPTSASEWKPVLDSVPPTQREAVISNLEQGTSYEVQVKAHSEAGTTVVLYDISTMIYVKGSNGTRMIAPLSSAGTYAPFYEDMSIIIPVISSTVATVAMIVGICICVRKNRRPGMSEKVRQNDTQLVRALDSQSYKFQMDQRLSGSGNCTQMHHSLVPDKSKTDCCNQLNDDNGVCPYATSRLVTRQVSSPSRRQMESDVMLSMAANDGREPDGRQDHLRELALDLKRTLSKRHLHFQYNEEDLQRSLCSEGFADHRASLFLREYDLVTSRNVRKVALPTSNTGQDEPHDECVKSQSWDALNKCLHRYPDLLYHGPESETSDEVDYDDVNFSQTADSKLGSGSYPRERYYRETDGRTEYALTENGEKIFPLDPRLCSNYPLLQCRPHSPLST